jgi:hypothetical protein
MDTKSALEIVEQYLEGNAQAGDYQSALSYLVDNSKQVSTLQKQLVKPGGIECVTAQELMPYFYDTIERQRLSEEERMTFLLHMAGCLNCAEEYRLLSRFEADFEFESVPGVKVPLRPLDLPENLSTNVRKITDKLNNHKYQLSFSPKLAVADQPAIYDAGQVSDSLELYSNRLDKPTKLELTVTVQRTSPTECVLAVVLSGKGGVAGRKVELIVPGSRQTVATDSNGVAQFTQVPIEALASMSIEL